MRPALIGCALFLVAALLLVGCGGGEPEPVDTGRPKKPRVCVPPDGVSGSPQSMEQAVDLINALPMPVTLPCLLESLDRPFGLLATSHIVSAQPAHGPNNPRMFLILGDLWLSVVPKGESRELLEFGERRSDYTSTKGELLFPVTDPIDRAAPFEKIDRGDKSSCAFCHLGETVDTSVAFTRAYVSQIVNPPVHTIVDREYLDWAWEDCDPEQEPDRCDMFDSIFANGEVFDANFEP